MSGASIHTGSRRFATKRWPFQPIPWRCSTPTAGGTRPRRKIELGMSTLVPPMDAEVEQLLIQINNLSVRVEQAENELISIKRTKASNIVGAQMEDVVNTGSPAVLATARKRAPRNKGASDIDHGIELWDQASVKQDCQLVDSALIGVGRMLLKLEMAHGQVVNSKEEHETQSAIMTEAIARGFLCRARRVRCAAALWKTRNHLFSFVLHTTRFEILRQRKMDNIVRASSTEREVRRTQRCFGAWYMEALAQRGHVEYIRTASRTAAAKRDRTMLRKVLRAWRRDCVGPQSVRSCRQRRAEALHAARSRVQEVEGLICARKKAAGEPAERLIITNDMVYREMSRTIYHAALKKQVWWCMRHHFVALRRAVTMQIAASEMAIKHYRTTVYGFVFYPWTEYLYTSPNATLNRKLWPRPRCYVPRYSQRLVDRFVRKRVRRHLIQPYWAHWRQRYDAWAAGRKLRTCLDARTRLAHWGCWRKAVTRRHELRSKAVKAWHETGRQLLGRPLRAWYLFTRTRRIRRMDQRRLVATHARARERRLRQKLMRAWHHQAIYGRVEGLYTRAELVRSLAELQAHGRRLEARAEAHAAACEDATRRLEDERGRATRAGARLKDRDDHATRMHLAIHHAEAEIDRICSAIECVAKLHPNAARTALIRSLSEHNTHSGIREVDKTDQSRKLPFKPESFLHELVRVDDDVAEASTTPQKSKDAQGHDNPPYEDVDGKLLDEGVDVDREVLMLRVRFVLDQASSDFRTFSHFGGKMLYSVERQDDDLDADSPLVEVSTQKEVWRSVSRDDSVDKVLKMVRDLKEGWQMWDFLVKGDVSVLNEKHAIAWKDMEGVAIDVDTKWSSLKASTLSGAQRLATWGEFLRALKHPGQQAL